MLKAGDILINDWLERNKEKNIKPEDLETYNEILNTMKEYNASKGQGIRVSDTVLEKMLTDPRFMQMFNKYNR